MSKLLSWSSWSSLQSVYRYNYKKYIIFLVSFKTNIGTSLANSNNSHEIINT